MCVLETTLADWKRLIDFVKIPEIGATYTRDGDPLAANLPVEDYFSGSPDQSITLMKFRLEGADIHCHFNAVNRIEFDIDPAQLRGSAAIDSLLEFMVSLGRRLRKDVLLDMPPWPLWLRGQDALAQFFATPRFMSFWTSGLALLPTRANGQQALVFYRDGGRTRHSIHLFRFEGGCFTELRVFIGPAFQYGFRLPDAATEQFRASELSG